MLTDRFKRGENLPEGSRIAALQAFVKSGPFDINRYLETEYFWKIIDTLSSVGKECGKYMEKVVFPISALNIIFKIKHCGCFFYKRPSGSLMQLYYFYL